jgi:DNA-binding NtrC family response regulator
MTEQILIVEDEFIVANDLRLILEKAGYRVCGIAASVEEAQAIIIKNRPDLVLLDIYLKGKLTGIDLARQLREQYIAFVYLSANSNQQILEEAKATDPYGFLVKPFRAKDVLITLDIARYRHKHNLQSGIRQEAMLQEKLATINAQPAAREQKLQMAVRTLQPFIPFDILSIVDTKRTGQQTELLALLRIAYDEYQLIGTKELLVITGFTKNEWSALQPSIAGDTQAAWFNEQAFQNTCKEDAVKKLLAQTFQLNALLTLPVATPDGESYALLFFSRRPDAWHAGHLALLQRLQPALCPLISNKPATASHSITTPPQNNGSLPAQHLAEFEGIIGNSHHLLTVLDQVSQVAPFDTSILILGESGTGKERIAHAIHHISSRKAKPFIKVNCAALPPTLIESELFGHEKGAFTGAIDRRIGKFEQAHEGTIFLDEIGEMPQELQVKLLRVLQEKEIERIGGSTPFKVNVRIIAATNRHLEKEVAEGRFRLDLYYRLNVFPIVLPPLRERKEDIKQLAHHFAALACSRNNKTFRGIDPQMLAGLEAYSWPGNIRELENVIEQSVILNADRSLLELKRPLNSAIINPQQTPLPEIIANAQSLTDIRKIQENTEREYILAILRKTNGRIRGEGGAAQLLDLKPTTLESKMQKLGIKKENL